MNCRLVFMVLWVLPTILFGQIEIGIRGGLNIADISEFGSAFSGGSDFFNPKASFHVGGFAKVPVTERVFLLGELIYSRKGSRLRDSFGNRSNFRLNYISMPILVGFQINDLSILFGTESGLNANNDGNSAAEFGLSAGLKYYLRDKLQVGFRFVQGLTAINNIRLSDNSGNPVGFGRPRNQLWQLSVTRDLISY